jgi:mannose-6-phosphate isomerase
VESYKSSYGHAFAIFGLGHAYQCTGDPACRQAALDTWQVFTDHFRDEYGGFALQTSRDFQQVEEIKSQNPVMHLFEALLSLGDLPNTGYIHDEAVKVAGFVLTRLVRKADHWLPEVYTRDWQEQPGNPAGLQLGGLASTDGRIDIGHAFEWAFLMGAAAQRGLSPTSGEPFLDQGLRFLDYGMRLGFDSQRGGVYSPASPEGKLYSQRKGWWEQCEATRALLHFALYRQQAQYLAPLAQMIDFIRSDFIDPDYGGWYSMLGPGIDPTQQDKGHEWKLDYHVVGMCMEAIRIQS